MEPTARDPAAPERRSARRYPIVAPARYRADVGDWEEAETIDIGSAGVLIRVRGSAPVIGAWLDMRIDLPADALQRPPQIACAGRVVRVVSLPMRSDFAVGVALECSELQPADPDPLATVTS